MKTKKSGVPRKFWVLMFVVVVVLLLDQATKLHVHQTFYLGESINVIPSFFNFTYVRNTGAAFGMLADADPRFRIPFFTIVPILALFAIGSIFLKLPRNDIKSSLSLGLVVGGAIGNLIDRLVYGFVIDFADFHWNYQVHFPAFNIADSGICVGVGLMILDMIRNPTTSPLAKEG